MSYACEPTYAGTFLGPKIEDWRIGAIPTACVHACARYTYLFGRLAFGLINFLDLLQKHKTIVQNNLLLVHGTSTHACERSHLIGDRLVGVFRLKQLHTHKSCRVFDCRL